MCANRVPFGFTRKRAPLRFDIPTNTTVCATKCCVATAGEANRGARSTILKSITKNSAASPATIWASSATHRTHPRGSGTGKISTDP
jgi:hypothetical protein